MSHDNIDDKIRQALSREENEALEPFTGEQSLLEQGLGLMRGRNRLINLWVMFCTLVLMVAAGICLWKFMVSEEVVPLIRWGLGLSFSLAAVSMFKLWAWMEIEKNTTIREIKRLELQVAQLSRKLDADGE